MVTGVAGCRMVTVCPGTPGAIWLATVWMTRLAAGIVANAMVGFSSKPVGWPVNQSHPGPRRVPTGPAPRAAER
jgi:hypothetical protein